MKIIEQKGFTILEIALSIIVIGLILFAGYTRFNKQDTSTKVKQQASDSTQSRSMDKKVQNPEFLEIKELGIKFELTDKIKTAYYVKINNNYYFSLKTFQDNPDFIGCEASINPEQLGVVALISEKEGEPNGAPSDTEYVWTKDDLEKQGLKKVGDRYYGFMKGNGGFCGNYDSPNRDSNSELISETIREFVKQTSTFTKI